MKKDRTESVLEILALLLVILGVALVFGIGLLTSMPEPIKDLGMLGTWISGMTAPFLGLSSTLFLYITLRRQRNDSAEMQKEIAIQRFENTLFQFISLHNQNIAAVQQSWKNTSTGTNNFFHHMKQYLSTDEREVKYKEFYKTNYHYIDHCYSHIILVLKFIENVDEMIINSDDKTKAYQLFCAQLSSDEWAMVYYHTVLNKVENISILESVKIFLQMNNILIDKADLQLLTK